MSDLISRADAIDACCRGWNNTADDCIRNIKAIPSAEPTGDLISRAEAIEAVGYEIDEGYEAIVGRINALQSVEPSGDLISRKDALNLSCVITGRVGEVETIQKCFEAYRDHIESLPSAEATCATCEDRALCIMSAPDGNWKACKDYRQSAEATKKKAELKENGDWDCPDVGCDECDHHRSVEWCSLAIPNHEEIDETYKMVNEGFFDGFDAAEKRYRFLIETVEELDKKLAEAEWIPCSERLPKKNGEYIVSLEDSVYPWARFFNGKWFMLSISAIAREFGKYEVVAWMPLPKPYREDGET